MEISPKVLREVEFRDKMKGYHPDDVDEFLEEVAVGLEVLQDRLRQAVERAQRAEQAAADVGGSDDTLRRTLVLAQRTADLAVQEAREQAAKILAQAEQQAQALVTEAEERARRAHETTLNDIRTELARLENTRREREQDVRAITTWVDDHRAHLTSSLQEALDVINRANLLAPAPALTTPAPTGTGRDQPMPGGSTSAGPVPTGTVPAGSGSDAEETSVWDPGPGGEDQPTAVWKPSDSASRGGNGTKDPADEDYRSQLRRAIDETGQHDELRPDDSDDPADPDEAALDEFFDDDRDDESRFGGRLRRRR